jgi:hypothetical protein
VSSDGWSTEALLHAFDFVLLELLLFISFLLCFAQPTPPLPPMTPCVFAFLLDDRCCTIHKSKMPMSLLLLFPVELIKEGSSFYAYFVFCVCVYFVPWLGVDGYVYVK